MGRGLPVATPQLATLIGNSEALQAIRRTIEQVADSGASVLVTGPSGSGKEVIAQLLHQRSRRAAQPFVALNCAAVAPELLESEMFGHEIGAFTGAVRARIGRFEAAHRGTLFLDEVGDMSQALQSKLLRVLETRAVERVGSLLPIAVDVRIIAATSVDLAAAIASGRFRADLLYRLDVIHIEVPPLCERAEDVPLLVEHFAGTASGTPVRFSHQAMALMQGWPWPGNVRELRNLVDRARLLAPGGTIGAEELKRLLRHRGPAAMTKTVEPPRPDLLGQGAVDLRQVLSDLEQAYIRAALARSGGAVAQSARLLGLQRTTLIEKMRRLQIEPGNA